jgi:hypothetical protein
MFDRDPAKLEYTRHALCRMDCRQISKEEIMEIMKKGIINLGKSDRRDRPCPTFALQGRTSEGDHIRVIFAQCDELTKVVTCYNLEKEFNCPECFLAADSIEFYLALTNERRMNAYPD